MGVKGATWILCHNKKDPEKLYCFKNRKNHTGDKRWNITEPTVIISKEGANNFHTYYVNEQRIILENTDNVLQIVRNLKLNNNYSNNFINDYKEHRTLYGIKKTRPIFEILTEENDESTLSEIENVNNHYSSSHYLRIISIVNNIEPVGNNESDTLESCSNNYHLIVRKYEALEEKLKDFCTENFHLQDNINNRIDEWRCGFLQIMEEFIHEVLHRSGENKFNPPYLLQQGLKTLRDRYCESERHLGMCAIIDKLAGLCGFRMAGGIVRPKLKSGEFIKVLGASLLLIEEIYDVFQWIVLNDYRELLTFLIETIEDPVDFPEKAYDYEFFNELVNNSLLT